MSLTDALECEHIVEVLDLYRIGDGPLSATLEYMDGGSLTHIIEKHCP